MNGRSISARSSQPESAGALQGQQTSITTPKADLYGKLKRCSDKNWQRQENQANHQGHEHGGGLATARDSVQHGGLSTLCRANSPRSWAVWRSAPPAKRPIRCWCRARPSSTSTSFCALPIVVFAAASTPTWSPRLKNSSRNAAPMRFPSHSPTSAAGGATGARANGYPD